jgi:hypothetical protein
MLRDNLVGSSGDTEQRESLPSRAVHLSSEEDIGSIDPNALKIPAP